MSQELKVKFTGDASDFNGAVKQIDAKLKGVGKLGQGLGLGRVGNGVGDFLQGIGGLGLAGGGIAGGALALVAGFKSLGASLDERAKAMEQGMPVAELTGFGRYFEAFRSGLEEAGRVFTGLPKLLTEGVQSYSDFVTGEGKAAAQRFADEQERAAFALADLEKTVRYEIQTANAMSKARERINDQRRSDARGTVEGTARGIKSVDEIVGGFARENQIMAAEQAGDKFGAELMRITDRINAALGAQLYSTTNVAQIMGTDIQNRLAMTAGRVSETVQSSPNSPTASAASARRAAISPARPTKFSAR